MAKRKTKTARHPRRGWRQSHCPLPRPLSWHHPRRISAVQTREVPDADSITKPFATLDDLALSRLQPVINGTGVIVHTNLGRAPIARRPTPATPIRRPRHRSPRQTPRTLNNASPNSAARRLPLCQQLRRARADLRQLTATKKEVVISRGELVQIGGGFRIRKSSRPATPPCAKSAPLTAPPNDYAKAPAKTGLPGASQQLFHGRPCA